MTVMGIDLGTTYSVVAVTDNPTDMPRMVPNSGGDYLTPSVVYFEGEKPVVGSRARLAASFAPTDCVELVKRHMGDSSWRFETSLGTSYTPEQISALIIRSLASDAAALTGEPCREAVVCVPAYFDDVRRRATADACAIAGLDVLRILNEPTAAALAFGFRAPAGLPRNLLVYDLGGGTFDVTVVRIEGQEFRVLATAGDRNLGGFDFDNVLMLHVDEHVQKLGGDSQLDGEQAEAVLRDRCEQAKRSLSNMPETQISLGGHDLAITRSLFEVLAAPLLRSTSEIVVEVMETAGVTQGALTGVLLVGGSTRMPMVSNMLEKVTGVRPDRSVHPDEAVAMGAAICAAELSSSRRTGNQRRTSGAVVFDVTAHSVGVVARSGDTGAEVNTIVIERNTPIPAQGRRRFHTLAENQQEIMIVVTEGEDDDPAYVTLVGSARVTLPPTGLNEVVVEVVLAYTADGMIDVAVVDAHTQRSLGTFTIDRQTTMDEKEIDRMRTALHSLDTET